MKDKEVILNLSEKYKLISEHLNERTRRIWAATEAKSLGHGGVSAVSEATGIARVTIHAGINELNSTNKLQADRIRNYGGGRKKLTDKDPQILSDLEKILEPSVRGDPESSLRWTCKSTRHLAEELNKNGYRAAFVKLVVVFFNFLSRPFLFI